MPGPIDATNDAAADAAAAGTPTPNAPVDAAAPAAAQTGDQTTDAAAANAATAEDGASTDDAASPGDDAAGEGAADDATASSGDDANAEAAPFEGLVAPEGFAALDTQALADATPILRGLGVDTPERAQEVVNQIAPVLGGMVERAVLAHAEQAKQAQVDLAASWANEVKADPVLGGANYEKVTAGNALVLDTFFPPAFREFLDVTGLGNNRDFTEGLHNIHKQIETGAIHLGTAESAPKELHQKLYDPVFDGQQRV